MSDAPVTVVVAVLVFRRGRWKLKVRQLVFTAFSKDELSMGFGFPKAERDGLIESDPETFFLPPTSDLRYQWVCACLDRLDGEEIRELVTDAWRLCVPRMLHDLPDLPTPAAAAWNAIERGEWDDVRHLLDLAEKLRERIPPVQARALVEEGWLKLEPLVDDSLAKLVLRAFGWYVLERHY